jgi:CheY-like chemotaxis protein
MKESILKNKMILAVDADPDFLMVLEEEILDACPDCQFHKVTTYKEAVERMLSFTYDVVLMDIIGVHGLELAELAMNLNFPIGMFTAHPITPEVLEGIINMKTHAYLPKERIGEIVPFLEDMLGNKYLHEWRLFFDKITGFLGKKIEIDWGKRPTITPPRWVLSGTRPHSY